MMELLNLFLGIVVVFYLISGLIIVSNILQYNFPYELTIGNLIGLMSYLPITILLFILFGLIVCIGYIIGIIQTSKFGEFLNKKIF
jgi:hypothetical protein